jgi:multiple sugar transport system permease protein
MRVSTWLRLIAITLITLLLIFPIYWMMLTSVLPTDQILSRHPTFIPNLSDLTFGAFQRVFDLRPFALWLLNSFVVSLVSTVLSLGVSILAGYSLSRWRHLPQQILGASLLFSKLIPSSIVIIPIFIIFNTAGMLDNYPGLIIANLSLGVPLATWTMKSVFDRVPVEIDQAAMMDGCSELQTLRYIVLPLTKPGLAACGIYLLIVSWSEFVFARTLMRSDQHKMLTVGIQSFVGEHTVDWATLMAAGTISLVPVIILFVALEPFLVSGLTKGALAN